MHILAIFPGHMPMWDRARQRLVAELGDMVRFTHGQRTPPPGTIGVDDPGALDEADVILGFTLSETAVARAARLRWVQTLGTGTDGIAPLPGHILLTSAHGLHGAGVSEATLALILSHMRRLPDIFANQQARRWQPVAARLLAGQTIGIVGTGSIARALAARAAAFDMQVIGFSRSPRTIAHFHAVHPRAALNTMLGALDILVLLAPLDASSRHLIGAQQLRGLRDGALLVNVGRGGLIDEAALITELTNGRIAAALDTFATEPLPADSPLWTLPNVLITPHAAGPHSGYADAVIDLFLANLTHYRAGRPERMTNRRDPAAADG